MENLLRNLPENQKNNSALLFEIQKQAWQRLGHFFKGIESYQNDTFERPATTAKIIWQKNAARLLFYAAAEKTQSTKTKNKMTPLFIVPSLVNGYEILDLLPGKSLVGFLNEEGHDVYLLDWGSPGDAEREFTLEDYIQDYLQSVLRFLAEEKIGPLTMLGYCMGGVMALAAAQLYPENIRALALLATPWDFHAEPPLIRQSLEMARPMLEQMIDQQGVIPVDVLQFLFHSLDPFAAVKKFQHFYGLKDEEKRQHFIATEDWLNQGVPLVGGVARETLFGWYLKNRPAKGLWEMADTIIDPAKFAKPSLVVIANHDRLVAPDSTLALAATLPERRLLRADLGHIGLMTGSKARELVWQPLSHWLKQL